MERQDQVGVPLVGANATSSSPGAVRAAALLVVLAVAITLSGCNSGGQEASGPATGDLRALVFTEGAAVENEATLRAATYEATRRCMQRQGFKYFAQRAEGPPAWDEDVRHDRERAARVGYGLATEANAHAASGALGQPSEATRATDAYRRTMSADRQAAYDLALFGPDTAHATYRSPDGMQVEYPTLGCTAEGSREVFGDVETPQRINGWRTALGTQIVDRVESDTRFVSMMSQWSACMTRAGVPATTPNSIVEQLTEEYRRSGVTDALVEREIRTALADLDCAEDAGTRQVVSDLRSEYLAKIQDEQMREAIVMRETVGVALERAERILADRPAGALT